MHYKVVIHNHNKAGLIHTERYELGGLWFGHHNV